MLVDREIKGGGQEERENRPVCIPLPLTMYIFTDHKENNPLEESSRLQDPRKRERESELVDYIIYVKE